MTPGNFPLGLRLKFEARGLNPQIELAGTGITEEMSSKRVLFTADKPVAVGLTIRLLIDWPSAEKGGTTTLEISGEIVNAEGLRCEVLITRYGFLRMSQ